MMEEHVENMRIGPEPFVDAHAAGTYLKLHPVTVQQFARERQSSCTSHSEGEQEALAIPAV